MMKDIFKDPVFRDEWKRMQAEDPDITLQDFILIINGETPEEKLIAESREEARQRRKAERRAERSDLEKSNDPLVLQTLARRKANPLPAKRSGFHLTYKLENADNSYMNSEGNVVRNSLTNISLC